MRLRNMLLAGLMVAGLSGAGVTAASAATTGQPPTGGGGNCSIKGTSTHSAHGAIPGYISIKLTSISDGCYVKAYVHCTDGFSNFYDFSTTLIHKAGQVSKATCTYTEPSFPQWLFGQSGYQWSTDGHAPWTSVTTYTAP
jgi:hypothetical protein